VRGVGASETVDTRFADEVPIASHWRAIPTTNAIPRAAPQPHTILTGLDLPEPPPTSSSAARQLISAPSASRC
jgi:hypothetical protein